ncbi:hypothetical protein [Nocardiopsis alba]|uniref:hypothetical protein n=1 Tax=Nocardiopsis alba TaxID=53437 RepID=UPI0035DFA2B1
MGWEVVLCVLLGVVLVATATTLIGLARTTSAPLPALDRSPRTGTVTSIHTSDETEIVMVEYVDPAGERHTAGLADLVHDSWMDRFVLGSRWQVYVFREPGPRVFLAEAHDDVVRRGYNLDGVRLGGESGPVHPPRPGNLLLKWRFEE